MIGKYVKRLWQDWPSKETKIRAKDLNKYEDTLKEHDDRLEELSGIEEKIKENKNSIQGLQNMSQASTYANNSVIITEEAKQIGTFLNPGKRLYQKGILVHQTTSDGSGEIVLTNVIVNDIQSGSNIRHLIDVKCSCISKEGPSNSDYIDYCMPGHGNVKISCRYSAWYSTLRITYSGMGTGEKTFNIIVQYTEET